MTKEITSIMQLYDESPSLVLYENLLEINEYNEKICNLLEVGQQQALNPIEVVLESVVNIFSEKVSSEEITHSEEKVLINQDMQNRAIQRIIDLIGNSRKKLQELHRLWLEDLSDFLHKFFAERKQVNIDELVFEVSSKFRISSSSAIKAIASIKI